ncbi:Uncharacterised protein [Mycobacterium tuberculosis]|uniref:Uncharacterized protein n=1 Tax=Mycobacterium tuberculosis TaxID=1773 RepID=A0A654TDN2_MYCTX|nr:Uncharacterised protein [Mycobacterium tuberculosis]CKU00999.1 Uncharacterised protein [Mycobacterium tuberculosis]COX43463.1 Uncharacterised protein [Mycobacterium tuberculosis]
MHQIEECRQPVDVVQLAGQRGRQVEPEPVDVHFDHPVAQRIHDQLQGVWVAGIEAVAGTGEVLVEPQVVVHQSVVGGVVDSAKVDRRTQVVAFSGVVVDDVEDDLDAGFVQAAHHGFELGYRAAGLPGRRVLMVRGEESEGVVTPVVSQAEVQQPGVV